MKTKLLLFLPLIAVLTLKSLFGHCQVPCGVYTDSVRFEQMLEDHTTIEKASQKIIELSNKEDALSVQQLSRWVTTKEAHASQIQKVISEYFLIQRIKPTAEDYVKQLKEAHAIMVAAMKCKQNLKEKYPENLKNSILAFRKTYQGK